MMFFVNVLFLGGLMIMTLVALFITLLNGTPNAIPFVLVVPAVIGLTFVLLTNKYFINRQRILVYSAVAAVSLLIVSVVPVQSYYKESIPRVMDDPDWQNYEPFTTLESMKKLPQLEEPSTVQLDEPLPRLDGAYWLYPLYAAFVEAVYPEGDYPSYSEGGIVMVNDTNVAYQRLLTGKTDLIFTPAPTDEQKKQAKQAGIQYVVTPIGQEAFVFFVHHTNPIDDLTSQQIRAIYSGKFTNWSDVGGENRDIIPYQRKRDSRSQKTMKQFMESDELMVPPSEPAFENSYGHVQQLIEYRNVKEGIGYAQRKSTLERSGQQKIKVIALDGIQPTNEHIQTGNYPYVQTLYAVTTETAQPNVQRFMEWMMSDEGQELVEKSGYVPLPRMKK